MKAEPATTSEQKLARLEAEMESMHDLMGGGCCPINSRGTEDIFGRKFALPVDAEHKGTAINLFSFAKPHMRAFHTSWFNFFAGFVSTFAAAPLTAYMEKESSLNLSKQDISYGSIASVSGTIVLRALMGYVMDVFGARKGMFVLMCVCTPGIIGMMFTQSAVGYILCRCLIGFSLATFVCSQTWCSQMFSKKIIGLANATAAGWGNLGGGITNLTMPLIFLGFMSGTNNNEDLSWRLTYIVPLAAHIIAMGMSWVSQDLPDGNYKELETSGAKQKSKGSAVLKVGLSNINAWILTLTYGACFGVELTMNNITAKYFYDYHGLSPAVAGVFASLFGLMNVFARSSGGLLSDWSNKKYGLRGRLWSCWFIQSCEGALCIVLGLVTMNDKAPHNLESIQGWTKLDGTWVSVPNTTIMMCGALSEVPSEYARSQLDLPDELIMITTPPSEFVPDGSDCISNLGKSGTTLFIMILFSIFVQAAEGLSYGIVPYVSRPALGVVSGMVGAGGSLGSVITLRSFFFSGAVRKDTGIFQMGIYILVVTALMILVYFPEHGGMLVKAGALGKYDPQLIKPPEGYRGADSIDLSVMQSNNGEKKAATTDVEVAVSSTAE
jgi:NNP family nitrate/nitrite transporter-like MFS transporter